MSTVISVENISKQYRLGQVGTGTLSDDLTRLWYRLRGKEDPFLKIGQTNDRTKKADSPTKEKKKGLLSSLSPLASSRSDLVWALQDINFEVKEGEVLGIIGRNGAGKSTLLKVLARVTTPTTGEVKVKGRIASLLEVGTGFHPDLSGRENIYLNGAILGMRKHEITRKLDEIIDFSGCERYIDTPVKRYSSGMYVRLAFAVAAHLEPEILIVDEVLAVGDAEFQKKCLGKMQNVAREGRTVLFVSHNLAAVSTLCTRGLLLSSGLMRAHGDVPTILANYFGEQDSMESHEWYGVDGDDLITLKHTWIRSLADDGRFETADDLEIGVEIDIHRSFEGLIIGFRVYSQYDYPLAYVLCDDDECGVAPRSSPGPLVKRFRIPGNTLAAGHYRIGFVIGQAWVKASVLDSTGQLNFELSNTRGLGRRYPVTDTRGFISIFRPAWQTK